MSRKFYTILILPHARSRMKKIHISKNFVWTISALLAALLLVGAAAPHLLLKLGTQDFTMERLRSENRSLREEKLVFESELAEMTARMHEYESHATKLAEATGGGAGFPPRSRPPAGLGRSGRRS